MYLACSSQEYSVYAGVMLILFSRVHISIQLRTDISSLLGPQCLLAIQPHPPFMCLHPVTLHGLGGFRHQQTKCLKKERPLDSSGAPNQSAHAHTHTGACTRTHEYTRTKTRKNMHMHATYTQIHGSANATLVSFSSPLICITQRLPSLTGR